MQNKDLDIYRPVQRDWKIYNVYLSYINIFLLDAPDVCLLDEWLSEEMENLLNLMLSNYTSYVL